ncbi:Leucine-rich repeat - like 10 [Theobroma cacao]|nr:Leucine-rich repeat - like 10 [Theobroma cacao]
MSLDNPSQNKIIVTTHSLKVASMMRSNPYQLKGLPHKECLTLFTIWAFNDGDERRDNEIWRLEQSENDISPALKLSYHHLPSPWQRCLAFLSLYEKDHIYYDDDVIQFWMANGLLEYPKQNQEWEDVGGRYLNELRSRCFIQDADYGGFKMHDLIHDLALDVSQKECKTLYRQTENVDEKVRHVSFCDDQSFIKVPLVLKESKHVRTIIAQNLSKEFKTIDKSFIKFCVSNFKYLRALDLSYSSLKALPNSVGTLKHLRYLDLSSSRIRKLPSSFYKLRSL